MKVREKDPTTKKLVTDLYMKGLGKHASWKAVAEHLNRPRRVKHEVNVYEIEKHAKDKETVVVAGAVLGQGEITKAVNVAAMKFSESARKKIEKAGGACMSIEELAEKHPHGAHLRILG